MLDAYTEQDRRKILVATSIASILTPLMSTMMNLCLPSIGSEFGVGSHSLAYVNTLFLLGSVVSMVPSAKYASIRGMKKVFMLGLSLLLIFCILIFLSPDFWFLILMRFMIGVSTAMLAVTSVAMLTYVYPITHRGKMLGINSTFVYLGLSLGPTIGGVISDAFGWRYVFVFIFILAISALAIMARFDREIVPTPGTGMDWKGAGLWCTSITLTMMGLVNITAWWGPVLTLVGLFCLAICLRYLRNTENPVLETRMFRNPLFSRSCVAAFMNYGASYCITYFLSLYLQSIGQLTATEAGVMMLVQPMMQVLLTAKVGSISDRMHDKRVLPCLGMTVTGIGVAMYLFLGTDYSAAYVVLIMIVTGVGLGIFSAPNNSLIMSAAPQSMKGEASGVLAVVRQTGMMVSMSLAMAVISLVMGSMDNLTPDTYGSFIDVIHITFAVCVAMCIVGAVCSAIKVGGEKDLN